MPNFILDRSFQNRKGRKKEKREKKREEKREKKRVKVSEEGAFCAKVAKKTLKSMPLLNRHQKMPKNVLFFEKSGCQKSPVKMQKNAEFCHFSNKTVTNLPSNSRALSGDEHGRILLLFFYRFSPFSVCFSPYFWRVSVLSATKVVKTMQFLSRSFADRFL